MKQTYWIWNWTAMGLSPRTQVMGLYREQLQKQRILNSQQLRDYPVDMHVTIAGLQIVRQQPRSAKGMVFIALEDEWGMIGIVLASRTSSNNTNG